MADCVCVQVLRVYVYGWVALIGFRIMYVLTAAATVRSGEI